MISDISYMLNGIILFVAARIEMKVKIRSGSKHRHSFLSKFCSRVTLILLQGNINFDYHVKLHCASAFNLAVNNRLNAISKHI